MKPQKPTHFFLALRPCGCWSVRIADLNDQETRNDAAMTLARAILHGHRPAYCTREEADTVPMSCPSCSVRSDKLPILTASDQKWSIWFRVVGSLTYVVEVPIAALIRADDTEQAREAGEHFFGPTVLAVDEGDVTVNLDEDCYPDERLVCLPMDNPPSNAQLALPMALT